MPRAFDHLVLGTNDLEALAHRFAGLGFQIGARNRHPWGTENRLIQLADHTFLELITVGEGSQIAPHAGRAFSFGATVAAGIARGVGLSMLALASADARADSLAFERAGLGAFDPFHFERKGQRPDGSEIHVAFTLAFAREQASPDTTFFVCQQHFPQNFWQPALQVHPNGAVALTRVTLVAENPSDHHIALAEIAGTREMRAISSGIVVPCGQASLEILTPEGFRFAYGCEAVVGQGAGFAGFTVGLRTMDGFAERLAQAGEQTLAVPGGITLPPQDGFRTAIRFERVGGVS